MLRRDNTIIYLVFSIGLIILSFPLFSKGMFMDGTIYAAVASNLSQGNGDLWVLKFSETLMNPFYEHPPLAIWLEAIFHKMFNDSFLSERLYSLFMWLLNGALITMIWKELKPKSRLAWFPLLLWVCMPIVTWSFSNNMLENTMGVFVSASVLFFLKGLKRKSWVWNMLSGAMLTLAFLSKGFVGLYPLVLPLLYFLFFYKERTLIHHLLSGVLMLIGFGILFLPFLLSESSSEFLGVYLEHQVKNSVENIQTVSHRFKILEYFLLQVFVPLSIALVVFFTAKDKTKLEGANRKWSVLFLILTLCGVLPIMISLKQRDFYILTVYPFLVITISLYVENGFQKIHDNFLQKIKNPKMIVVSVLMIGVVMSVVSTNFYKRDKEIVMGVEEMAESEFAGKVFDCSNNVRYDWSVMAYLSRISKISVWRGYESKHKVMFVDEEVEDGDEKIFRGLKLIQLDQ